MLKISDLNTFYGDSHVLHNVSLTVEQGKVTVLLGRNGMGKTTTIHSIMGIIQSKKEKLCLKNRKFNQRRASRFRN